MYTILPYPKGNIQDCNLPKWHSIWTYRPPLSVPQASELPGYKSNFDAGKVGEWRLGLTKVEESTGKQRLFQGCIFWNLAMTTLVPCRSSRFWVQTANIKFKRNTNLKHQPIRAKETTNLLTLHLIWLTPGTPWRCPCPASATFGTMPRVRPSRPAKRTRSTATRAERLEKIWASCQTSGEMQRSISRLVDRTKKKQLSDSLSCLFSQTWTNHVRLPILPSLKHWRPWCEDLEGLGAVTFLGFSTVDRSWTKFIHKAESRIIIRSWTWTYGSPDERHWILTLWCCINIFTHPAEWLYIYLQDMRTMGFWAEGVAGKVHLEIKSVPWSNACRTTQVLMLETALLNEMRLWFMTLL